MAQPGYDYSVYDFTSGNVEVLPWIRNDVAYPANGSGRTELSQRGKNDISEKGMDEEVHGFASADKNVPPIN